MKYVSIAIVIIFIGLVIGFWIKKAPKEEPVVPAQEEQKLEEQAQKPQKPEEPKKEENINKIKTIQGMKIETTKEGTGAEITNGKTAVVHYTGKLTDGKVFDSSVTRGTPFEFPLGAGMVIKGWELGVLGMKVGEKRILTIPADLGYGERGAGGVIPPNATLIFEVELLAIK
ncbi:MAG TPA: FKBP-type peptidyl-prolyl cis-trans isomerase [Candidatus Paceibacterota bacterium]|nr:FKBP-type peptidyl-prolyl cis-trans isomerase [Candidatus Paceibacterota bacterium]